VLCLYWVYGSERAMKWFVVIAALACIDAHAQIVRQDVRSIAKSGSTGLTGAVTLSEGGNGKLTQSGNNIAFDTQSTITATVVGTASGNTTYTPNQFGVVTSGSGNAMSVIAPVSSTTTVLTSGGTAAAPTWQALIDEITGMVETPSNKTYVLDQSAPFPYTINTLVATCTSGGITGAIKINGTAVTGISALAITSSAVVTGTASAANTVNIGDKVTFVTTSNAAASDVSFTLKVTR
jgi:hypothetical protein